jgi:PAS domain S-box-containing protein
MLLQLAQNITLVLSLLFVYGLLRSAMPNLPPRLRSLLDGLTFGVSAILGMMNAIPLAPGVQIDGRTMIITIAALTGGRIPGGIAAAMVILFRLYLGGAGAPLGVMTALTALTAALLLRHYLARRRKSPSPGILLGLGLFIALQTLFWLSLSSDRERILSAAALPILLIYPVGVVALGLLFQFVERQLRLSEALKTSEERYRSVIDTIAEGVLVSYTDQSRSTLNASARRILGEAADLTIDAGQLPPGWQLLHEDGRPATLEDLPGMIALRTREPRFHQVMGLQKPDGSILWVSGNAQPLFKPGDSTPCGTVTTITDITDQRLAREQLAQERNLLRTLIDSTPDYIFIKDRAGRFVMSNIAHAQAAGTTPEALAGKTAFDTFPPELAAQYDADDRAVMESGQPLLNVERTTVDASGRFRTVLTNKIPLVDSAGVCTGLIGISRDISDLKQLENKSKELAAEQQRISLLRQFIRDLSHDFRTPLTIITTSVYLLEKLTDPEQQRQQLTKLSTQVDRLKQLFDELLTMTRLDNEVDPMHLEPVDIHALVGSIVDHEKPSAQVKYQTMTYTPAPELPPITGDEVSLRRAITAVLTNAILYTPEHGAINVCTRLEAGCIIIEVQDSGIGMSEDTLAHIFERLYRADDARSTHSGGMGLGLSIAKKIVEAHGGAIRAESIIGQGSTFYLCLPVSQNQKAFQEPDLLA